MNENFELGPLDRAPDEGQSRYRISTVLLGIQAEALQREFETGLDADQLESFRRVLRTAVDATCALWRDDTDTQFDETLRHLRIPAAEAEQLAELRWHLISQHEDRIGRCCSDGGRP